MMGKVDNPQSFAMRFLMPLSASFFRSASAV
jgi:hypothetical protein